MQASVWPAMICAWRASHADLPDQRMSDAYGDPVRVQEPSALPHPSEPCSQHIVSIRCVSWSRLRECALLTRAGQQFLPGQLQCLISALKGLSWPLFWRGYHVIPEQLNSAALMPATAGNSCTQQSNPYACGLMPSDAQPLSLHAGQQHSLQCRLQQLSAAKCGL